MSGECFSEEELKWINPLKEVLKKNGVKCDRGSLALMCDINNIYQPRPAPVKERKLLDILEDIRQICALKSYPALSCLEEQAEAAKKRFAEVVEEMTNHNFEKLVEGNFILKSDLLKRIDEL